MKELSLYKIRDMALDSGRTVFSVQQLSNLIGKPKPITTVYLSRLVEHKMAFRVMRGRISFEDDDFIISTQLVEPSYISVNSALLFHGIINQITKNVECVTTRNTLTYKDLGINYHKIPESLFFGYKRHEKGKSYVFVAEPAKALIDGLYLNIYSESEVIEYAKALSFDGIKELLSKFKGKGSKKLSRVIKLLEEKNY